MLRGGFDDNFSGYPLITHSVRHAGGVLNIEISLYTHVRRLSPLQTQGNVEMA